MNRRPHSHRKTGAAPPPAPAQELERTRELRAGRSASVNALSGVRAFRPPGQPPSRLLDARDSRSSQSGRSRAMPHGTV